MWHRDQSDRNDGRQNGDANMLVLRDRAVLVYAVVSAQFFGTWRLCMVRGEKDSKHATQRCASLLQGQDRDLKQFAASTNDSSLY